MFSSMQMKLQDRTTFEPVLIAILALLMMDSLVAQVDPKPMDVAVGFCRSQKSVLDGMTGATLNCCSARRYIRIIVLADVSNSFRLIIVLFVITNNTP